MRSASRHLSKWSVPCNGHARSVASPIPLTVTSLVSVSNVAVDSIYGITGQFRWASISRENVRNIAVIAHVDHGKTTLVDAMLKQSGTLKEARNRVMDSKDQEKERGITILAKNTAIVLDGAAGDNMDARRINILDTPGHLDFGGEVERALQMVEGFILLVDAKEGVRPGTRYVLRKALTLGLKPIVCINKIDKDDSTIEECCSAVQDLFLETIVNDDQVDELNFLYGSSKYGYMNDDPIKEGTLTPLFDRIFEKVTAPKNEDSDSFQLLVGQVDRSPQGQPIALGRIFCGSVKIDDIVSIVLGEGSNPINAMVKEIKLFVGIEKIPVKSASFGDICTLTLQEPISEKIPLSIGSTICSKDNLNIYPYKKPDEPTYSLRLRKTESSWKGKETLDNFSMLQNIQKRLERERMVNSALLLEGLGTDVITMMGRGPLHLSVIVEDMRREGFEFEIMAPSVLMKVIDGVKCEPFEFVTLEYKEALTTEVVSLLSSKMADIGDIKQQSGGRSILECSMPVRMMTTLPITFNTLTAGDGVLNHNFDGFKPCCVTEGERETGALISVDAGKVEDYSLAGIQQQGRFFVLPGDDIYYGQIVGENTKTKLQNMAVNLCKKNEQQGGMRANATDAGKKRQMKYSAQRFTFEDCISWIVDDEMITVTPKSIRMRKPNFNGKTSMRSFTSKKK